MQRLFITTAYLFSLLKIKLELDAFERSKDEESKKFKSHNIDFEFHIVTKIRESMVNLSSNCMELALKVSPVMRLCHGQSNMYWRVF